VNAPLEPLDLARLLEQPPAPPDWLWDGRIALGDVALWVGDPGVGKSMVALRLAVLVARGGGRLLDEPAGAGPTVYVDLENTIDVVLDRLRGFSVTPAKTSGLGYVLRPSGFNLAQPAWRDRLRATLDAHRPRLLIIDSLRRAAPGLEENDSAAVSALLDPIRDLAAAANCAIILVHHPRKPLGGEKVDALYAARGSGDLTGSADVVLYFRRLSGGLVRIEQPKARRGHPHAPAHYRIAEDADGLPHVELVEVDEGADDELFDAVIAHVTGQPGEAQKTIEDEVTGSRRRVREALERGATLGQLALGPGRHPRGKYWYPANHAAIHSPGDTGAIPGDTLLTGPNGEVVAHSPPLNRSGASGDTHDPDGLEEALEWR
jgi:hypothetical protein